MPTTTQVPCGLPCCSSHTLLCRTCNIFYYCAHSWRCITNLYSCVRSWTLLDLHMYYRPLYTTLPRHGQGSLYCSQPCLTPHTHYYLCAYYQPTFHVNLTHCSYTTTFTAACHCSFLVDLPFYHLFGLPTTTIPRQHTMDRQPNLPTTPHSSYYALHHGLDGEGQEEQHWTFPDHDKLYYYFVARFFCILHTHLDMVPSVSPPANMPDLYGSPVSLV